MRGQSGPFGLTGGQDRADAPGRAVYLAKAMHRKGSHASGRHDRIKIASREGHGHRGLALCGPCRPRLAFEDD